MKDKIQLGFMIGQFNSIQLAEKSKRQLLF